MHAWKCYNDWSMINNIFTEFFRNTLKAIDLGLTTSIVVHNYRTVIATVN